MPSVILDHNFTSVGSGVPLVGGNPPPPGPLKPNASWAGNSYFPSGYSDTDDLGFIRGATSPPGRGVYVPSDVGSIGTVNFAGATIFYRYTNAQILAAITGGYPTGLRTPNKASGVVRLEGDSGFPERVAGVFFLSESTETGDDFAINMGWNTTGERLEIVMSAVVDLPPPFSGPQLATHKWTPAVPPVSADPDGDISFNWELDLTIPYCRVWDAYHEVDTSTEFELDNRVSYSNSWPFNSTNYFTSFTLLDEPTLDFWNDLVIPTWNTTWSGFRAPLMTHGLSLFGNLAWPRPSEEKLVWTYVRSVADAETVLRTFPRDDDLGIPYNGNGRKFVQAARSHPTSVQRTYRGHNRTNRSSYQ